MEFEELELEVANIERDAVAYYVSSWLQEFIDDGDSPTKEQMCIMAHALRSATMRAQTMKKHQNRKVK